MLSVVCHDTVRFDTTADVIATAMTSPVSGDAIATQRRSTSSTGSTSSADSATSRRALQRGQGQDQGQGHVPENEDDDIVRILVAFTFVLELAVLVGMSVLEYYLR